MESQKTPISRLQEICAHNGKEADYKLLSVEGVVHAPTFIYRVHVGEFTATATGQSKKKARHAAAKAMIERLINDSDYIIENPNAILEALSQHEAVAANEVKEAEEQCEDDDGCGDNPVGKLQEICMKLKWRPPHYDSVNEEGLPHERMFTMRCFIENMEFEEFGTGKSKRLAKRKAAHNMIKRLKAENLTEADELTEKLNDKKYKNGNFINDLLASRGTGPVIPAKVKIENFYNGLEEQTVRKLCELISDCELPNEQNFGYNYDEDFITVLKDFAILIDCDVKYLTVPQLSCDSYYQCFVHLIPKETIYSELPVLTAWGSALDSTDDAKQAAAGSAIKLFMSILPKHSQSAQTIETVSEKISSLKVTEENEP